jgi:hypothetical protein
MKFQGLFTDAKFLRVMQKLLVNNNKISREISQKSVKWKPWTIVEFATKKDFITSSTMSSVLMRIETNPKFMSF